jgi:hypothetical protein
VEFNSVKLHCAELYLKGNNKKFYFKALWRNLKHLGVATSDMVAKENVIIVKRIGNLEVSDFLRVTGVSKLIPCYIVEKQQFKQPKEGDDPSEAESDNIDLEKDEDDESSAASEKPVEPVIVTETVNPIPPPSSNNTNSNNDNNSEVSNPSVGDASAANPASQPTAAGKKKKYVKPKLWRSLAPRPKRPEPEILAPRDDEYLKRIVSLMCGMVSHALAKKQQEAGEEASLRFKITANFVLNRYFNMSRADFQIRVGQYIRDRFNDAAPKYGSLCLCLVGWIVCLFD